MNTFMKIIDAQDRILQHLEEFETQVHILYSEYAKESPDLETFWKNLAGEEKKHASLINTVRADLKAGKLMHELDRFSIADIQERIDSVECHIAEARTQYPGDAKAVANALSIESSIIDSHFFDIVQSDGIAFQTIAKQLTNETNNHIKIVQKELLDIENT